MSRLAVLLAALSALAAAAHAAAAPPTRVELTFAIMLGKLRIGEARELIEHDGRRYHVVSESVPTGVATLLVSPVRRESRGAVTPGGLRPDHFEESGRRGGKRVARFDWGAGQLTLTGQSGNLTLALPEGTLDQASLAYAPSFGSGMAGGFAVHVTDGRGVKQYHYREIGEETLRTPLGEIRARHFEKVRDAGDRRGFEFWLAPERHLLPVKLRYIEKNGEVFESVITDIRTR